MRTDKVTVKGLFGQDRRYMVPLFQRGYVWSRVGQWEPLWNDIVAEAATVHAQRLKPTRRVRRHFLGAVVISEAQNTPLHVPSSDVIDGQQRLTTLQVLLAAFRDVAAEIGDKHLTRNLTKLTLNEGDWPDADEQFKVWPTNAFREDFRRIQTAGSAVALADKYPQTKHRKKLIPERPALVQAYLYFADAVRSHLRTAESEGEETAVEPVLDRDKALDLLEAIQNYLQLVAIELDIEDDPQIIFETLNARGVPLEASDLIRNFIFFSAHRQREDTVSLYENGWKHFDETPAYPGSSSTDKYWKLTERQGRLKRSRLDLFLFHYVTFQTGHEIKIGHLFQEFHDWWNDEEASEGEAPAGGRPEYDREVERKPSVVVREMVRSAQDFAALITPTRASRFGIFASRLKSLDTTTAYPLLLWIARNRESLDESEFLAMLADIESYLVRRAVCELTTKNYNTIFLGLLRKLKRASAPTRDLLANELLSFEGESSLWPTDDLFEKALLNRPLYTMLGPVKTQMILEALDQAMYSSKSEKMTWSGTLTVEHVLPQFARLEDYPYGFDAGDGTASGTEISQLIRADLVQSLGNLTLLTQALNSSVGNGPFAIKRKAIAEKSRLALNVYFQQLPDGAPWNENTILQRARTLAAVALRVWRRPTG